MAKHGRRRRAARLPPGKPGRHRAGGQSREAKEAPSGLAARATTLTGDSAETELVEAPAVDGDQEVDGDGRPDVEGGDDYGSEGEGDTEGSGFRFGPVAPTAEGDGDDPGETEAPRFRFGPAAPAQTREPASDPGPLPAGAATATEPASEDEPPAAAAPDGTVVSPEAEPAAPTEAGEEADQPATAAVPVTEVDEPLAGPDAEPDTDAEPGGEPEERPFTGRRRRARHARRPVGRVAFAAALVVLIAAIPALGLAGRELVLNSRDGRVLNPVTDAGAPGYQALLASTPTALVVQTMPDGTATTATVLALGSGDTGGSVLFVPLDTATARPANGVDRLETAFAFGGFDVLEGQAADLLNLGFDNVVPIDDQGWAAAIGPIGSLTIENPDSVYTDDGLEFPSGPLELQPDEVGPFLSARNSNESDLNRLVRHRLVWQAWLQAVDFVGPERALAGVEPTLARFVKPLSQGTTVVQTLAVVENEADDENAPSFLIDPTSANQQLARAVPFPSAPAPGTRVPVRLLNGVDGEPVPPRVADALVRSGAEITTIGNARTFGQRQTRIEYYRPEDEGKAEIMRAALGVGDVSFTDRPDESVAVSVVVGADLDPAGGPGG